MLESFWTGDCRRGVLRVVTHPLNTSAQATTLTHTLLTQGNHVSMLVCAAFLRWTLSCCIDSRLQI